MIRGAAIGAGAAEVRGRIEMKARNANLTVKLFASPIGRVVSVASYLSPPSTIRCHRALCWNLA